MRNHLTEYKEMITIIALLLFITVIRTGSTQGYPKVPEDCGGGTNMDVSKRTAVLQDHNWKRYYLATGIPFPNERNKKFPNASDMNVLYYDCDLEKSAYEIAKGCHKGDPDFDYVGSNNETYKDYFWPGPYFIQQTVNNWWNTALHDGTLVDLKPSEENSPMVPFLQMANGGTNKLGCAYHICNYDQNAYYEVNENNGPFLLFVCKYGDPQIKLGSPIYTDGPPCESCRDRCTYFNALCDTKIV